MPGKNVEDVGLRPRGSKAKGPSGMIDNPESGEAYHAIDKLLHNSNAAKNYVVQLRQFVAYDEIRDSVLKIVRVLLRTIKTSNNDEKLASALDGLAMTAVTYRARSFADTAYLWDLVHDALESFCTTTDNEELKARAIRVLAVVFVFDCRSRDDAEQVLDFLVSIIRTDGEAAGVSDSSKVVIAAMQSWSFVADVFADKGGDAASALESFVDQLESPLFEVQIVAATQVAFLLEAVKNGDKGGGVQNNLYLPYRAKDLLPRLTKLARGTKALSKKRRHTSESRSNIDQQLQPIIGAINGMPLRKQIVWPNPEGGWFVLEINTMSTMMRMQFLDAILEYGLMPHYMENNMVAELLEDVSIEELDQIEPPEMPVWGNNENEGYREGRPSEMSFLQDEENDYLDD